MTNIKLCGLSRPQDIQAANQLRPEFVGVVFAPHSPRYVSHHQAQELKALLAPGIQAVGVFVREEVETVAQLLNRGVIDMAQLHGGEGAEYIRQLRSRTCKPIIQAFSIASAEDVALAKGSSADYVLLDSGAGTGTTFDWSLIGRIGRPYFLAGGLHAGNVEQALAQCRPYAVDTSSGIETDGVKDPDKIAAFVAAVRKEA